MEKNNNRTCILISSYDQHKNYLDKFIYSIIQKTPNDLPIYVIISKEDEIYFAYMRKKYANVNLIIFSKIVELLDGIKINECDLLKTYGKYKYQSLKKYYGIYYLFYNDLCEHVIIFDSESIIVKPMNINELVNTYIANPFLIYSESDNTNNELHTHVEETTNTLLDLSVHIGWFLEYYLWIYDKKIFIDFMNHFINKFGRPLLNVIKQYKEIFIEIVYQTFIYKNNASYNYSIINFDEYLRRTYHDEQDKLIEINKNIIRLRPLKPVEDCRVFIDEKNSLMNDVMKKFYETYNLSLYKTSDTEQSLDFIKNTESIKMCVSEYSDLIYKYYNPEYFTNCKNNYCLISKNIAYTGNNIFRFIKNAIDRQPFNWFGYEMSTTAKCVKFTFEIYFDRLDIPQVKNYIAFKRHYPSEIYKLQINNIGIRMWHKFEYTLKITSDKQDLYIIIFDDAPRCDVLIRNFEFEEIQ